MKVLLIILFTLLSLIHNLNLGSICLKGIKEFTYYYCKYSDGQNSDPFILIPKFETNPCSISKCSNSKYNTRTECEKSFEWIEGKCYRNIKDKDSEFLPSFKNKQTCEEEKADWTMNYCSFQSFRGNIYNQIKNDLGYDNEKYDQSKHFTKEICEEILNGNFLKLNGEDRCFFKKTQKLNEYFCNIINNNIGYNEDCPYTMDSEKCEKLGGIEYGVCSIGNIFGEAKDECQNLSKNEWKTGKNEAFCFEDLKLNTKELCSASPRGEWETTYGVLREETYKCEFMPVPDDMI